MGWQELCFERNKDIEKVLSECAKHNKTSKGRRAENIDLLHRTRRNHVCAHVGQTAMQLRAQINFDVHFQSSRLLNLLPDDCALHEYI